MPVRLRKCNGVVAVPGVKDRLFGVGWNDLGLVEGRLAVVGFPGGVLVQLLKIDGPPKGPFFLGADYHVVAPSVRGPQGNRLQHA